MKIGVWGTGMVGVAIGDKLIELGHEVMMGSRTPDNEKAAAWVEGAGERASQGTFADAAAFGELVFNCAAGQHALAIIDAVDAAALEGKVLVDISNPLDFSNGMPPTLTVCNDTSLGEQIQEALPATHVVKALNTVNCDVMVDPSRLAEPTDIIICGEDAGAKGTVTAILTGWFGWQPERVIDLGGIAQARGTEMFLPLWVRLYGALGTPDFNIKIVRAAE